MKLIGITGGIGSGKSTLSHLLSEHYDIPIIDADELSKRATEREDVLCKLQETFGTHLVVDGVLNRSALGQEVFTSSEKVKVLNGIIHPIVFEEFDSAISKCYYYDKEFIIYDCPLLIEANLVDTVDIVVVVEADIELRLKRMMQRTNLSREQLEDRICRQVSTEDRLKVADIVVYNNAGLEELTFSVASIFSEIQHKLCEKEHLI